MRTCLTILLLILLPAAAPSARTTSGPATRSPPLFGAKVRVFPLSRLGPPSGI